MNDDERACIRSRLDRAIRFSVRDAAGLWPPKRLFRRQRRWAGRSLTLHLQEILASVHPQCIVIRPNANLWEGWVANPLPETPAQWRFLIAARLGHLQWDNHREQWAVQPLWSVRMVCRDPQIAATVYTPNAIQTIRWNAEDHVWSEAPDQPWAGSAVISSLQQAVAAQWLDPAFVLDWRHGRSRTWRLAAFFVSRSLMVALALRSAFHRGL